MFPLCNVSGAHMRQTQARTLQNISLQHVPSFYLVAPLFFVEVELQILTNKEEMFIFYHAFKALPFFLLYIVAINK